MAIRPDPKAIAESLGGEDDEAAPPADDKPQSDLEAACADLLDAVDAKDPKALAEAFKHCLELADSES